MPKADKGEVSIKQLDGILHKPGRKPVSIEEMHEEMMLAVVKANVPSPRQSKKR